MLTQEFKTQWMIDNSLLFHKLASKFRYIPTFEYPELLQIVKMYAWEALGRYNPDRVGNTKCKISTYVYTHVLGYVQLEYARNSRAYKVGWKEILNHPVALDIDLNAHQEDVMAGSNMVSDFTDAYVDTIGLRDRLKQQLTPLEYEVLLTEFDLDPDYSFKFSDYLDIVKPTLYPIVLNKVKNIRTLNISI
jgi:hypothetical protein